MAILYFQNLSDSEKAAVIMLKEHGMLLLNKIPDKNEKNAFGDITPGINAYKKLVKKGICFQIEEEEMEDGFSFTDSFCLTELGENISKMEDLT